jgi:hypothetical protein
MVMRLHFWFFDLDDNGDRFDHRRLHLYPICKREKRPIREADISQQANTAESVENDSRVSTFSHSQDPHQTSEPHRSYCSIFTNLPVFAARLMASITLSVIKPSRPETNGFSSLLMTLQNC